MSKKQRQQQTKYRGERLEYLFAAGHCQVCCDSRPVDVHEIARGPARSRALGERCTWLALCRECHERVGDYEQWPIIRQLAVKLLADAEHFDLELFNSIRGRAAKAITLAEIVEHLELRII